VPPPATNLNSLLAASYGTAVGALVFNTQPAIVGALAESFELTESDLGNIIATTLIGVFCLVVSSFYWIHRVRRRATLVAGPTAACLGAAGLVMADGFVGVAASLAILGIGGASVYVVCLSCLASATDPTRAFGVAITMQVAVASLTVYLIPSFVLPLYGIGGVAVLLILLNALAFGIVPLIPERQPQSSATGATTSSDSGLTVWVMLGLVAMTVYFVGLNGTWPFLERIGVTMSLAGDAIGRALAASLLFGAIGSLIASVTGRRVGIAPALLLSGTGFLIFIYLMLEPSGVTTFTVALVIFNAAWNFSLPYQMDLISQADAHHRFIVLVPAAQTIGGAMGPAIAGPLLMSSGVMGVYAQLIVCVVAAFLLYGFIANRLAKHHEVTERHV